MSRSITGMLFILMVVFSLEACEKESGTPDQKTDTTHVNKIDTIVLSDTVTTFILTRHAETTGSGTDPMLSSAGEERAAALAQLLKGARIGAVYATNYNRTKQTAAGVAINNGLTVQIYDPNNLPQLVNTVLAQHKNKVVYIAGHSNTTPDLLNELTGTSNYSQLPETEYDNLYVVSVVAKGNAKVVHMKYGN